MIETENGYRECSCVEIERVKAMWRNSGMNTEQQKLTFTQYKPFDKTTRAAKKLTMEYTLHFDEIKHKRDNSFGLFGNPGAGKTHLAISIGTNLLNRKENPIPVVYMPYLEVMRELKANSMDDEYYQKLIGKYCAAKLLIVDDLFKDKVKQGRLVAEITGPDMKHIYPIINYRYNNYLPMVISSECRPEMLTDLDEALGSRIMHMCGDNYVVFHGNGYNYRMKKIEKQGDKE